MAAKATRTVIRGGNLISEGEGGIIGLFKNFIFLLASGEGNFFLAVKALQEIFFSSLPLPSSKIKCSTPYNPEPVRNPRH